MSCDLWLFLRQYQIIKAILYNSTVTVNESMQYVHSVRDVNTMDYKNINTVVLLRTPKMD